MKNNLLKVIIVFGVIDIDRQSQIWLKNPNLPHFELVHTITHHLLKLESQNLEMQNTLV